MRVYTGESRVSWLNFEDIRQRNTVFSDVIAQRDTAMSMAGEPLPGPDHRGRCLDELLQHARHPSTSGAAFRT